MALIYPTSIHSSNYIMISIGLFLTQISFNRPVFCSLLPNHTDRPLATAHESVKTQTQGKISCNSADLFLPSLISVAAFPTGCCLITQELPSIKLAAHCWLIKSFRQGTVQAVIKFISSWGGSVVSPRGKDSTCL